MEDLKTELDRVLRETRQEPGLSLEEVANSILTQLSPEECIGVVRGLTKGLDKETAQEMRDAYTGGDPEAEHINADKKLCNVLRDIGFTSTVRVYENIKKWYA